MTQQQQDRQPARRTSSEETRLLRAEVAQLKDLVSQPRLPAEDEYNTESSSGAALPTPPVVDRRDEDHATATDSAALVNTARPPEHPRNRAPHGYYSQHSLFKYFVEV